LYQTHHDWKALIAFYNDSSSSISTKYLNMYCTCYCYC